MADNRRKLVTIVTEALIEAELCREIERLGARGYTVTDARGAGSRGVRDAGWDTGRNVRIEAVCAPDVAERIETRLREHYFESYAMICFTGDVDVMRSEKF